MVLAESNLCPKETGSSPPLRARVGSDHMSFKDNFGSMRDSRQRSAGSFITSRHQMRESSKSVLREDNCNDNAGDDVHDDSVVMSWTPPQITTNYSSGRSPDTPCNDQLIMTSTTELPSDSHSLLNEPHITASTVSELTRISFTESRSTASSKSAIPDPSIKHALLHQSNVLPCSIATSFSRESDKTNNLGEAFCTDPYEEDLGNSNPRASTAGVVIRSLRNDNLEDEDTFANCLDGFWTYPEMLCDYEIIAQGSEIQNPQLVAAGVALKVNSANSTGVPHATNQLENAPAAAGKPLEFSMSNFNCAVSSCDDVFDKLKLFPDNGSSTGDGFLQSHLGGTDFCDSFFVELADDKEQYNADEETANIISDRYKCSPMYTKEHCTKTETQTWSTHNNLMNFSSPRNHMRSTGEILSSSSSSLDNLSPDLIHRASSSSRRLEQTAELFRPSILRSYSVNSFSSEVICKDLQERASLVRSSSLNDAGSNCEERYGSMQSAGQKRSFSATQLPSSGSNISAAQHIDAPSKLMSRPTPTTMPAFLQQEHTIIEPYTNSATAAHSFVRSKSHGFHEMQHNIHQDQQFLDEDNLLKEAPLQKARRRHGTATDPQSIAARTRREKFSDRIRILQSLVPKGERLDTVSVLGQTLEYIRFLQHQVRELYRGPDSASNMSNILRSEKWKDFVEAHSKATV